MLLHALLVEVTRKWMKPLSVLPPSIFHCSHPPAQDWHRSLLYIFFSGRVTSWSLSFGTLLFPQSAAPNHLSSAQLSQCPSLPHWMSSVILPILLPLTRGMTKTVSHLLQTHLYSLYKCISQPLLYETEYIQGHVHEHQLLFCPTQLKELLKYIGCLSLC